MSADPKPVVTDPKPVSADAKKLVPILILVAVLSCGCIAVPFVGGLAMLGFMSARYNHAMDEAMEEAQAVDVELPHIGEELRPPQTDFGGFGGLGSGLSAKEAARQRMVAAEERYLLANAQYEGAQALYEMQRNNNNAQAGRLGAQGISLPPPQPPDPSLAFEVQAARAAFEAAKAEYESLP
jgi:hypothetical protein